MINSVLMEKNEALFDEFVPHEGFSETKAGELIRAVNRIGYRFWNDGDMIGVGYGNETCNAAARFIMENYQGTEMDDLVNAMWGITNEKVYEYSLELLVDAMVRYVEGHPELKTEQNEYDMFDFEEPEDKDWYEDEEEESVFYEPWASYEDEDYFEPQALYDEEGY